MMVKYNAHSPFDRRVTFLDQGTALNPGFRRKDHMFAKPVTSYEITGLFTACRYLNHVVPAPFAPSASSSDFF